MKYLPLLWRNLWRRKVRTIFTFLSIVVAFLLFGVPDGDPQRLRSRASTWRDRTDC
jgi:hypothetical protein